MMVKEEACGNVKYSNLSHIIGRQLEVEYAIFCRICSICVDFRMMITSDERARLLYIGQAFLLFKDFVFLVGYRFKPDVFGVFAGDAECEMREP